MKYPRALVIDLIVESQRDKCPFILNDDFILNDGEPFQVNSFYKNSDQLTNSIEKMIDKYDEDLEVLFTEVMIKYTMVFNKIKKSNYGKGSDGLNKNLEYEGNFCFIPTTNACLGKCLEKIYEPVFVRRVQKIYIGFWYLQKYNDISKCSTIL